jgi:hypothetical protein
VSADSQNRAKYIEGLENRLGRMEHLLRLSGTPEQPPPISQVAANGVAVGLLGEDDNGATDLGTLEKKLVEKHQQSRQASQAASDPISPQPTSARDGSDSTPHSSLASPEPAKDGEKMRSATPEKDSQDDEREEVAELSEMMCSLVTNNNGETRYIGTQRNFESGSARIANVTKVRRPDSPSSRQRACSGSTRRWATHHSSK